MQSSSVDMNAEDKEKLPPVIILNRRQKIKPKEVTLLTIYVQIVVMTTNNSQFTSTIHNSSVYL